MFDPLDYCEGSCVRSCSDWALLAGNARLVSPSSRIPIWIESELVLPMKQPFDIQDVELNTRV
jgi:hypothetical protein